jgi:hypothetical protein
VTAGGSSGCIVTEAAASAAARRWKSISSAADDVSRGTATECSKTCRRIHKVPTGDGCGSTSSMRVSIAAARSAPRRSAQCEARQDFLRCCGARARLQSARECREERRAYGYDGRCCWRVPPFEKQMARQSVGMVVGTRRRKLPSIQRRNHDCQDYCSLWSRFLTGATCDLSPAALCRRHTFRAVTSHRNLALQALDIYLFSAPDV